VFESGISAKSASNTSAAAESTGTAASKMTTSGYVLSGAAESDLEASCAEVHKQGNQLAPSSAQDWAPCKPVVQTQIWVAPGAHTMLGPASLCAGPLSVFATGSGSQPEIMKKPSAVSETKKRGSIETLPCACYAYRQSRSV